MAIHQHATLEDTVYFWFGSNDTGGSGDDGAAMLSDVRLAGAAAGAAPVISPAPTLLTHANYPDGCYEVAVDATAANGFAVATTYGVFVTLLVDGENPTGFVGSFSLFAAPADMVAISGGSGAADNAEAAFDGTGYGFAACVMPTTTDVTNMVTADMIQISGDAAAANNAELAFDGTGYGFANCVMPITTTVTNMVTSNVIQISGDVNSANNLELDYDGTGYAKANSTIGTCTTNTDMRGTDGVSLVVPPSVAQFNARTRLTADYFSWATDTVARVTLCDTTTAVTNMVTSNAIQISGDATAANNCELAFDGTGYGFANCVMPTTTDVTNGVTVGALGANVITAASLDATATNEIRDAIFAHVGLTAGGVVTFGQIVRNTYAGVRGRVVTNPAVDPITHAVYDDDNATLLFTLSIPLAGSGRTVA